MPDVRQPQPQASKPPAQAAPALSPKEALKAKLARVRILREKMMTSRAEVTGKDPSKSYSWVNCHETRLTWFKGMGWELAKDPKLQSMWKKEDGTHVRGDLILCVIDKETKELFDLDSEVRAVEAIQGNKDAFLDFAATNRVPAQLQEV